MADSNTTQNAGLTIIKDSKDRWQVCRHDKTSQSFQTFETLAAAMTYAYSLFNFNS